MQGIQFAQALQIYVKLHAHVFLLSLYGPCWCCQTTTRIHCVCVHKLVSHNKLHTISALDYGAFHPSDTHTHTHPSFVTFTCPKSHRMRANVVCHSLKPMPTKTQTHARVQTNKKKKKNIRPKYQIPQPTRRHAPRANAISLPACFYVIPTRVRAVRTFLADNPSGLCH